MSSWCSILSRSRTSCCTWCCVVVISFVSWSNPELSTSHDRRVPAPVKDIAIMTRQITAQTSGAALAKELHCETVRLWFFYIYFLLLYDDSFVAPVLSICHRVCNIPTQLMLKHMHLTLSADRQHHLLFQSNNTNVHAPESSCWDIINKYFIQLKMQSENA